jgi:hypothetical protein
VKPQFRLDVEKVSVKRDHESKGAKARAYVFVEDASAFGFCDMLEVPVDLSPEEREDALVRAAQARVVVYRNLLRRGLILHFADSDNHEFDAQAIAKIADAARWSWKAGCSCGCSPGFILEGQGIPRGHDVFITARAKRVHREYSEARKVLDEHGYACDDDVEIVPGVLDDEFAVRFPSGNGAVVRVLDRDVQDVEWQSWPPQVKR